MNFRPKPGQSDEDLIRQNEEFLKLTKRKSEAEENPTEIEGEEKKKQKSDECGDDNIYMDPKTILSHAKAPGVLLSDIQENKRQHVKAIAPSCSTKQAFPEAFRRDKMIPSSSGKKLSIFAQMQQKKLQQTARVEEITPESSNITQTTIKNILSPSDAQQIHEENVQKLSCLSSDEILAEKQKLMEMLDPSLLQFFKSKNQAKQGLSSIVEKLGETEEKMEVEEEKFEFKPKEKVDQPMPHIPEEEGLADLPIPPEEAKRWLHMDVVESDKLKWMTKLPPPRPLAPGTAYPARFNFNGDLLPPDANVPETEALHHHGVEPERAGYTLEELLLFSRSSNIQQRALGLTTIANILKLVSEGRLDECVEESILSQLVSAGIFSALRFSLDDSVAMVTKAASLAMAALLASQPDETCLGMLLGTCYGVSQPCMPCPLETEEKEKGDQPLSEGELRDHELLQLDVIKGALRTDIVPRIRYLLEIVKPDPKTVLALLQILTRLARHSREITLAISHCPELIATLCTNFLPSTWDKSCTSPVDMSNVYGVPLAKCVKLLRVMAAHSKALASDLVHKYGIMTSLLAYLNTEPSETGLPDGAVLLMESAYLWQTIIRYGIAVSYVGDFASVLGRLLSFHLANTKLRTPGTFYQEHAVALLSLIQSVVALEPSHVNSLPKHLLISLLPAILRTTGGWITQAGENEALSFSDCKLVGASLNTLVAMYQQMLHWVEVDSVSWLSQLEHLISSAVIPFLQSQAFKKLSLNLKSHSSLLDPKTTSGRKRDHRGLPSLGSVIWGQTVTSTLQPASPLPLIQPMVSFVLAVSKIHPQLNQKLIPAVLTTPGVQNYLTSISDTGCPGSDHWFSLWEVDLTFSLLMLAATIPTLTPRVLHQATLNLLPCIRLEHKLKVRELFASWVFHQRGFSDEETLACGLLGAMELSESSSHQTVLSSQPPPTLNLLNTAYNNLQSLQACYAQCMGLTDTPPVKMISQSYPAEGQALLPKDWPFLPLVMLANQQQDYKPQEEAAKNPRMTNEDAVKLASQALQWILLLETSRPEATNQMLSVTARFSRLACVFLAGSDVFLDPQVHGLIESILHKLISTSESKLDFSSKIPGLNKFWDLYLQLVQQYVGESYGDKVFAQFILIPLQQKYEVQYRKLIWGEQASVIRYLSLPIQELLVGVQSFLEPMETDPTLLTCYLQSLRSGLVRATWSPILHKVACHHVTEYIRRGEDVKLRDQLLSGIKSGSPELQALFLHQ